MLYPRHPTCDGGVQAGNPAPDAASNRRARQREVTTVSDDEVDLLRSVFALAHQKRPPLSFGIVQAMKGAFRPRKPIIKLDLIERNDKEAA